MTHSFKPYDYREAMREQISTTFTSGGAPVTPLIDPRFESMVDQRLDATVTVNGCVRNSDVSAPASPIDQVHMKTPPLPQQRMQYPEPIPKCQSLSRTFYARSGY